MTLPLTDWLTNFYFWHYRVTIETCNLWGIWSEWWEDMTWPKKLAKTMTKTKTKTMTMTMTNTFWEHLLRAILETCDIWDTDYNSDNFEFMTIFVNWQLTVTLDSIRNSCDVWCNKSWFLVFFGVKFWAENAVSTKWQISRMAGLAKVTHFFV